MFNYEAVPFDRLLMPSDIMTAMCNQAGNKFTGGPVGYRKCFCVLTLRTCFMAQPVGRATYCQSKAGIFSDKFLSYKLPDRPPPSMSN